MNYVSELELGCSIEKDTVYVIYTEDGPYDTLPTREQAEVCTKLYGLPDYSIVEEKRHIPDYCIVEEKRHIND